MGSTNKSFQVGVVGDATVTEQLGESSEFDVSTVSPPKPAANGYDCLLVPQGLDSVSWRSVLRRVTDRRPALPVVVLVTDQSAVESAIKAGATDYVPQSLVESRPTLIADRLETVVDWKDSGFDAAGTRSERPTQEYEQIFNGVNDAIVVFDPKNERIVDANASYHDLLGYDLETIRELGIDGLSVREAGYTAERGWRLIQEVAETGESITVDWRGRTRDGEHIWLEATLTTADIGGETRVLSIQRDVTERRQRQRRLEAERDRRSILFENTPDPIMAVEFVDKDPYITEVNEAFEAMFGLTAEDVEENPITDAFVPDSEREGCERICQQAINGESVETEVRCETDDGVKDFLLRVLPYEADHRRQAYVWYTDITERKRRERAIKEERQKYSTLVEQSTDGVVVVRDGEYVFVNEQFVEMTGYEESELLGMSFEQVFAPADRELVTDRYRRRVAGESPPDQYDLEVQRADGTHITLETSVSRIQHDGDPATMATLRDVTERRERERAVEELQSATERLQAAETRDAVYQIAVETARDVLELPMTACWRHDDEREQLEYVTGTDPVEEMPVGPVSFTPDDHEYDLFQRGETTTYDPSRYHNHNPMAAAILVPLGNAGLLAAGHEQREEYEPYFIDIMQVLAGHVTGALERVAHSKKVRKNERRLQAIVDRIDEAIFLAPAPELTKSQPAPDFISSGYQQIWGQPLEQLHVTYENGFFDTLHPDDDAEYRSFIDRVVGAIERGDASQRYGTEYRIQRPDGEVRWVHSDFYPTAWEEGPSRVVVVSRDVTERKERERTLESFHDATAELTTADSVTEAGAVGTAAAANVFDMPATAVYRYSAETGELVPTATGPEAPDVDDLEPVTADDTTAWAAFVDETVEHVQDPDIPALDTDDGDEILLFPLGGNGLLAVWHSTNPFDTEAATILAATLEAALNRLRGEQRLEDSRAELAAQTERARQLEVITELTRRVEAALTGHSSQRDILEAVCDELVEVTPFTEAWVAAAEVGTDRLTPRTVAGTTRDDVEQALAGEANQPDPHPARDVWQRGEPRVVADLVGGSRRSDWRQRLLRSGSGSVCAVPLAYNGITYGVLTIVADTPDAFGDRAVEILSQLGTSVGYAITSIERQRALESDDTLEIEFQGTETSLSFARLANDIGSSVRLERTVRRQDGSVSVYYTLESGTLESDRDRAAEILPGEVTVVSQEEDQTVIERSGSSWFGSLISEYGGLVRRGRATPERVELVVELPLEADTRTIVERIQDEFPGLELTAQRQHSETDMTPTEVRARLQQRLSDRQYEALETAHTMGYFAWPRENSGEEVAERLGITQPTVNKHVRLGEQKVFDLLFGSEA